MNRVWQPRIRKGERIYEHENKNANAKPSALLRDGGGTAADGGDPRLCGGGVGGATERGQRGLYPYLVLRAAIKRTIPTI